MVLVCYYSDDIVSIYAYYAVTTIMTLYEDVSDVMFVAKSIDVSGYIMQK